MKELLILLRAMQIYAQNAHHLVKGSLFFQDHGFFGDAYEAAGSDFDSLAERIVGKYGEEPMQLQQLMGGVNAKLADAPSTGVKENKIFFQHQLKMEQRLCELVEQIIDAGVDPGVEQLVGEICNKSQSRQYFINQRLK